MAKARKNPTRGGGGASRKSKTKNSGFEVEEQGDEAAVAAPSTSLETALIYVTFVALLVGVILAQMDLGSTYGKGMFGG